MAAITLTTEAIAQTEKKMDMTLDDIIKMSKKTSNGRRPQKVLNKSRGFQHGHASQVNSKVQWFMESRSSIRQGVLAQKRSNFQGNKFPLTVEAARKAAAVPIRGRAVNRNAPRVVADTLRRNARGFTTVQRIAREGGFARKNKAVEPKKRPQTLDALFAGMKEQRMRVMSQQQMPPHGRAFHQSAAPRRRPQQQQQQQQPRGSKGVAAPWRRLGNFAR